MEKTIKTKKMKATDIKIGTVFQINVNGQMNTYTAHDVKHLTHCVDIVIDKNDNSRSIQLTNTKNVVIL